MTLLSFRNRQQARSVDSRLLRTMTLFLLKYLLQQADFELGFHLVGAKEMAAVNEKFLQHTGSTDVITFDHSDDFQDLQNRSALKPLHGEIFISIDDALLQAKEFGTTWQSELVRYVVHGILHLRGFDDLNPVARKKMKREENRLVQQLQSRFPVRQLHRRSS